MEIVLEKQVFNFVFSNESKEILVGWHKYVKNGLLVESSYQSIEFNINSEDDSPASSRKITLVGKISESPISVLFYLFKDLSLAKHCNLDFKLLPNSTTQASWKLRNPPGLYVGPPAANGKFTLPKNLILIKHIIINRITFIFYD